MGAGSHAIMHVEGLLDFRSEVQEKMVDGGFQQWYRCRSQNRRKMRERKEIVFLIKVLCSMPGNQICRGKIGTSEKERIVDWHGKKLRRKNRYC